MRDIEIEKIFVNLLKNYLDLPDNYGFDSQGNEIPTVIIRGQNIKLFNTDKLQITISTISSNVFANRKEYKDVTITNDDETTTDELHEVVYMNDKRIMQIDIYSRNNEARQRLSEVQMALTSTLAEQLQDEYQFRIGKISNATNLSGLDGGSDVNRYTIRFNCLNWYTKEKVVQFYDKFRTKGYDEKNGEIFSFNIER